VKLGIYYDSKIKVNGVIRASTFAVERKREIFKMLNLEDGDF